MTAVITIIRILTGIIALLLIIAPVVRRLPVADK
jgi:hypothetical protein